MAEKCYFILLLNLVFFAKTLTYKYVSDDIPASKRPKHPKKLIHWLGVIEGRARSTPQIDHFITTVVHALTAMFVYLGFGADNISFLAAILFSLNPINNQASVWISGRAYAFSALGMTMALTFPMVALAPMLLATYYNAGFLFPFVFLGSSTPYIFVYAFICWLAHFPRFRTNVGEKIKAEMFTEDRKLTPRKLVLAIKTFGFYFIHALVPIKTTFYHSFLHSAAGSLKHKAQTMKDRFFWLGVIIILGIISYWSLTPWTTRSFALLWWTLGLLPFINFFRCQQEIAERYTYLPLIGLMYFLASYIYSYPVMVGVFIGMYATKLWFWMDAYQDDYYLVENSRIASPDSWFAWHIAGLRRWDVQSVREAMIMWTMARMISPKEFKINFNLATSLKILKNDKEAEFFLKIAEDNIPAGMEETAKKLIEEWRSGQMPILI